MRLKHATFLAKLLYIVHNTTRSLALMKYKGSAFLQRCSNPDETFLRGLFAWRNAEPNRNLFGQDMINPKHTMQRSVLQQCNVSHSMVGIVDSGYGMPGSEISSDGILPVYKNLFVGFL